MQELETQLREDLLKIGLDVKFKFSLRQYSKTYFGRYDPNTNTVILYVHKTPKGDMYPYMELLLTAIHEVVHCLQWNDPKFKRVEGIMHDPEFKRLYALYSNRAKARILFREVGRSCDSFYQTEYRKTYDSYSVYG